MIEIFNNGRILQEWFSNGNYNIMGNIIETMMKLENEEQRIKFLKEQFINHISKFKFIPIWESEEKIPDWDANIHTQHVPAIIFFPAKGNDENRLQKRGCLLVAPGGGYNVEADTTEGWPIIKRLTDEGFNCALLVYRVRPYSRRVALKDAQRAIRCLRYYADVLHFKKDKIGMIGGSAGGNLTCMCGVHFDEGNMQDSDKIDRLSCRPDACISMYGTFSACSYPGAEDNTDLGSSYSRNNQILRSIYSSTCIEEAFFCSPEKWVTPKTPPFFLWQTCDEDDPRQLFIFAKALTDAGVRFEAHIYPFGGHGLGLADGMGQPDSRGKNEHVMHWMDQAVEWLKMYGF